MKLTLANPPEGFEAEAEYRKPVTGDYYLYDTFTLPKLLKAGAVYDGATRIILAPKKPKRWEPELGETYHTCSIHSAWVSDNAGSTIDVERIKNGLVFKTYEQAERMVAHLQKARDEFWAKEAQQ